MKINHNENTKEIELVNPSIEEKVMDAILENKDAGIILASYLGTAIIIYVLGKIIAEIIIAFHKSDK